LHRVDRFRRRWLVVVPACVVVALGGLAVALASSPATTSKGKLPVEQLVAVARGTLEGHDDPHVESAWVIATTKNAAEHLTYPGSEPPDPRNPLAYLIVLRGRFVCDTCSFPAGAQAPRGPVAYVIWVPGQGISDFGLPPRVPSGLRTLGPIVNLRLIPPPVPRSNAR